MAADDDLPSVTRSSSSSSISLSEQETPFPRVLRETTLAMSKLMRKAGSVTDWCKMEDEGVRNELYRLWLANPGTFDWSNEEVQCAFLMLSVSMVVHTRDCTWHDAVPLFIQKFDRLMRQKFPTRLEPFNAHERVLHSLTLSTLMVYGECVRNREDGQDMTVPMSVMLFYTFLSRLFPDAHLLSQQAPTTTIREDPKVNSTRALDARFRESLTETFNSSQEAKETLIFGVMLLDVVWRNRYEEHTTMPWTEEPVRPIPFFPSASGSEDLVRNYWRGECAFSMIRMLLSESVKEEHAPYRLWFTAATEGLSTLLETMVDEQPLVGILLNVHIRLQVAEIQSRDNLTSIVERMEMEGLFESARQRAAEQAAQHAPIESDALLDATAWAALRTRLIDELRVHESFEAFVAHVRTVCATCCENRATCMFEACAHIFFCRKCFEGEYRRAGLCPLCRIHSKRVYWLPSNQ